MASQFSRFVDRRRAGIGAAALVAAALAIRLGVLLLAGVNAEGNAFEHGEIAQNLLAGRGFSVRFLGVDGPTSQQAPLYPLLLAGAALVTGELGRQSLLLVELLQCLAGAVIPLAAAAIGWAVWPQRRIIGWTAGWIAAVYPPHLYMATQIQIVVWAALLLTLLVALAVRGPTSRPTRHALLLGCVSGLLLLVEPILALALPVVCAAAWQRDRQAAGLGWLAPGPAGRAALMAATALLVIAPWLVRNYRVHGEFVFVKSSFGYAFWQGNNEASWGTDKIPKAQAETLRGAHDGSLAGMNRALWDARHETIYIDDLLLQASGYREFQGLTEPQRSRLLQERALRAIEADPARYVRLSLQRLRYFLLFDETNPKAANRLYRATTVAWLVLAMLGLLVTRSSWRAQWPTYAIFGLVTLFHCLTITSARFRMPLEPLTFVWIAAALGPWGERLLAGAVASVGAVARRASGRSEDSDRSPAPIPPPHILGRGKNAGAGRPGVTQRQRG